ncbi:4-hydroxy-3-methylbut-2-en-1-yl diphosphatesynthase [Candidatus Arthromitus sp. SFB-mouse-Japan]|uniref:flavodoxin-dependent (E)-4-hydroxy-3-methylbut-2-enyl-diphosphate synthase n=1 Tax=unclassified Candidatus Neoarthromitus TaxID=2638829 RepID=UPI00021B7C67|nr:MULTISPECIES: flavodoxin-dependent (E)-4-hydroxy-3-methylbut-2-enyl-diphosphate synthase [unclassified Candidatus Arthromitus]EIA26599.1 4-hydroxy-3-methylbut-2-en-1-yl diphosphate synthase [Candidatus Arthromitus sp. SFB-3]EIA27008.1 4-hydroxy-3-methylbut-2-en-1-yl diphosphate synthase [Candidatus Arthromitus sp. SFB-5]EIA28441.1 4-hydroxy-3-methylbut-2-en-1-yl diphosphate synthase [Candidatus Arthromitus sp. SFB-co]EIA30781.1 4-hydroxy-3-methylbut-2-en-1-yl diphosphate synthase [Candidatus
MDRILKKEVRIGNVMIGGCNPIAIQSMTNTNTKDVNATINQINVLEKEGCNIVRIAITDNQEVDCISKIKKNTNIPLVADIQFDYRIALACIKNGIDKVRINPGNIGNEDKIREVVNACEEYGVPIRIGVNGGSLQKDILSRYGKKTTDALVESALKNVDLLEKFGFRNIVISVKSSDVEMMIESYKKISSAVDYPLHLGVTEAGLFLSGAVKSSIGIGTLLHNGIGDTIRVSLTDDPVNEVKVSKEILKSLNIYNKGVNLISCPTCSRTKFNLIDLANKVEQLTKDIDKNITIAVMGCAVNGPGEAREADIGVAGGNGEGLIFKKGEILRKVKEEYLLDELKKEIDTL